jgi:hypothetical protein
MLIMNVGMARGVIGVEAYVRSASSANVQQAARWKRLLQRWRLPNPGMVLSKKGGEDSAAAAPLMAWKRDESRVSY